VGHNVTSRAQRPRHGDEATVFGRARRGGHRDEGLDVNSCDNPKRLKIPQVDHETHVEKWLIDRHRSEKSVP
jgi:hypothetical protein